MDTRQENSASEYLRKKTKVFSDHTYFYILDKTEGNLNSSQTAMQPPP